MFRFIKAWLQAMFRCITAWLQSAAADDPDAASLEETAAMDFPVTVSLGPLHRQLQSFKATKNNLPDGISEGEIQRLKEGLEILFTELKIVSEADDPSFTAKCWMKEVRELRYDAEDFFDEVLRPCAGDADSTRRSVLLAIILWIPSKLKRRRQVAKAFSDLRARVKDASQRRQSFQLGPATIRPAFGQGDGNRCSKDNLSIQLLEESMDKLVKLLALPDEDIVELLAFDIEDAEEQVQVVPIFGFAGVGKTTLARTFYRNFVGKFQCRAFVRASRNPDMRMLLSSMLSQIKAPPVHGFSDVQDLIDKIREYLQCKRYLIVIDDLWASSTWDIIRCAFPDGDCCSRIIVTTEIKDVALACCRHQFKYMYEMGPLNGDQSRKLFVSRAFGSENDCAPDFKEFTDEIIQKCGGLPLATENIASMLACELNIEQWKHVRDSLPSSLSLRTNPSSEGLKEVLNIIYNNLSPKLKTCLLYIAMYPEGYTINKDELVKQWVAEDFIGKGQDREKLAGDCFDELISRGMIQPVDRNYNDEVLTCTVHHMVLDLIRYKSSEENFIIAVSCSRKTTGLPDKVRRLSVQFGGAKCGNVPADFMITQVRSLIFFGYLNCAPSIVEYKLLRVLILHVWADQSKIFDLTRITELFQLRYLKIECNITVHLPDEIRQLKFLETLEIHAPVNDMPLDISCLPLLHTLGYFDLSKNSIENVQNLGELNNLQHLHLTWSNTAEHDNLKNNMQRLGSILWKLSNLKSLTLVPAGSSHADDLDDDGAASMGISGDVLSSVSSPPALLERLELSGRCCMFSSLPEWTKEPGKLCILKIAVRKLLRKDIDILKGLPALRSLSLYIWTAPVGKVVFDNEGFSVLKYFKFICAAPCVVFLKGAMPSVRELKLAFSANKMKQYSQIIAGLEYLIELKEITAKVWGTGADESHKRYAESAFSDAIANHPRTPIVRVQHIDRILCCEEDTNVITQEQHWTLEEQHEIQEELLDRLAELVNSTPSTQTQMRDGGQNEGTDRSIEVLTQEQEHWTPEKRGMQEELLDPVPECLSTPSTPTKTSDGVQGEQIEGSKDVLTHELEHCTLEKQHEIQEELLDPLPEALSTVRSREVLSQEHERWTLVKQHKIKEESLDPLPTQTKIRDGVQGELIEGCSPENFEDGQELSPRSSPLRSPALRSRYPSAPPSPMHPNLFAENYVSHLEGNASGLDASSATVDDMDKWLRIFNLKLRHMREYISSIESCNNGLEMQSVNDEGLVEELEKSLERFRIPQEFAASLTGGSFEESRMLKNVEACEWLTGAIRCLEVPNLDPSYVNMPAVRKKKAELEKLKITFVRRASEFLRNYFSSLVDFMISDKSYFSQRGQLKRPDHADLRYKCRTYARLLQHLKSLDKSCLGPIREAYCHSLNLLLRREAREFANELRVSTKAPKIPAFWLEGPNNASEIGSSADTSTVSDAYSKMLTIFIPLLVDECSFFAHFMCFEVPALVPAGAPNVNKNRSGANDPDDDDLNLMDPDGNDIKPDNTSMELGTLNEALQELLDGIQEDFYVVVDLAYKIDPLRCISMHGITERYLSGQKADAAGFVRKLLDDLESRISALFSGFIDEACHQIERNERNVRRNTSFFRRKIAQKGILAYILRLSVLASRMEQYIQGQSRDLIDKAYTKLVSTAFTTLEKIAQSDPKTADILLIENYAAFQNSLYDLANVVPALAKFYHQASESYEQACTRHISSLIYLQFERLFQFSRRVDELTYVIAAEEIPFQLGLSKTDLRRVLKSSLSGIDKSIGAMYKRLQKTLTADELFPSLWDKCKKDFLDKYESFVQMVTRVYGNEPIMPVAEMRDILANF